jgi:hypothetical protein
MQPQIDLLYKVMVERFDSVDNKFEKIETKVDDLCNFKWKIIGFSTCAVSVISFLGWIIKG